MMMGMFERRQDGWFEDDGGGDDGGRVRWKGRNCGEDKGVEQSTKRPRAEIESSRVESGWLAPVMRVAAGG